jgi:hypothetical protein
VELMLESWSYCCGLRSQFHYFGVTVEIENIGMKKSTMDTFTLGRNHGDNILISTEERTA